MIYLHCGWPKTGTTSFQAALARNQERLADAGIVYPDEWRRAGGKWSRYRGASHNAIPKMLESFGHSSAAFDQFAAAIAAQGDADVLISSESITLWALGNEGKHRVLMGFLAAAGDLAPVKCVWTLRRFDEWLHSQCLQAALAGRHDLHQAEFGDKPQPERLFPNMRGVEDLVSEVAYLRYEPRGGHNVQLLPALGVPAALGDEIGRELSSTPHLHVGRSHKQVVASANVEALSERLGLPIERETLLRVFDRDGFGFRDDRPCVLFDAAMRRDLHEHALELARESGFEPYVSFFARDEIASTPAVESLDADVLDDGDLARLEAHLRSSSATAARIGSR